MRVADIYERYNPVTDWRVVKSQVDGLYIKGSDGAGDAIVKADNYVRRAMSEGIRVGLYHFAQKTPSPRIQANVLTNVARRLNAVGLPPALDLEDSTGLTWTASEARQFAEEFHDQLKGNGFRTSTLYGNRSMLDAIKLDLWLPDYVYVWLAEYGNNDGTLHTPVYRRTRVDLHQFTSNGTIRGISGRVDVNDLRNARMLGESDMALKDEMIGMWDETQQKFIPTPADAVIGNGHNHALAARRNSENALNVAGQALNEVREVKKLLTQLVGQGLTLNASGEIVVKATPPVTG